MMCTCKNVIILLVLLNEVCSQKSAEQNIQSYHKCKTDVDCKANAFCYGNDHDVVGKCKCEREYVLKRNTTHYECVQKIDLGEACNDDFECQLSNGPQSFCNKYQLCACKEGSQPRDGKCYLTVNLGDTCLQDGNCALEDGSFGFCTLGRCVCPVEKIPSWNNRTCVKQSHLGHHCTSDDQCASVLNAICRSTCRCPTDHVPSRDINECVKAATKFGEECTFDGQCSKYLTHSICSNNSCACEADAHFYSNGCLKSKKLGEGCSVDAECHYDEKLKGVHECRENVCRCVTGKENSGACSNEDRDSGSSRSETTHTVAANILLTMFVVKLLVNL